MTLLQWAVIYIVTALIFYTIAVWAERFAGRLKIWHLGFFLGWAYSGLYWNRFYATNCRWDSLEPPRINRPTCHYFNVGSYHLGNTRINPKR